MGRSFIEDALGRNLLVHRFRMRTGTLALGAAYVLTDGEPDILFVDPNGAARNFDMPAVSNDNVGRVWLIINTADGAEALTVRQPGGGATLVTISVNEMALVTFNGTTYYGGVMLQT